MECSSTCGGDHLVCPKHCKGLPPSRVWMKACRLGVVPPACGLRIRGCSSLSLLFDGCLGRLSQQLLLSEACTLHPYNPFLQRNRLYVITSLIIVSIHRNTYCYYIAAWGYYLGGEDSYTEHPHPFWSQAASLRRPLRDSSLVRGLKDLGFGFTGFGFEGLGLCVLSLGP